MSRRLLVTGGSGQLGRELVPAFEGWDVLAPTPPAFDLSDRDAVLGVITSWSPDAIVHAGAWTDVDGCERQPDLAWAVNALGTRHVTDAARLVGAHLCVISTDYVFDGRATTPYTEWDPTTPLSVYGRSKLGGEREALMLAGTTVVRTSWLCGPSGRNFVATMLRLAAGEGEVRVVHDQHGCFTSATDLAQAIRRLVAGRLPGVFHVTNQGETTWFELARATFASAGYDPDRVRPIATTELDPPRPAPRPAYSVLDNAALRLSGLPLLGEWPDALHRLVKELAT
jgi:dTDP-4-dehydrorhamnose reductase